MNLWIRSQNKEELTNPMYLQIIKVSNNTKYAINQQVKELGWLDED